MTTHLEPTPIPVPSPPVAAKPPRFVAIVGIALLLVGALGGAVITRQWMANSPQKTAESTATDTPDAASNEVTMSREQQAKQKIELGVSVKQPFVNHWWRTGRIALNDDRLAHISPPAEGIIREVPVRLGQTVAAGDVLAVLDCRELGFLKMELVKARSAFATERDSSKRIQSITSNATELLRLLTADTPLPEIEKKLADKPIGEWRSQLLGAYTKRNQLRSQLASQRSAGGALSETTIRKTESESDAADAAYTALVEELRYLTTLQVRQAELKEREAQINIDVTKAKLMTFGLTAETIDRTDPLAEGADAARLVVKAPFAGTIVEKHAVRSERVGPDFQMFVLSDLSTVWVQADVFETDLALLRNLTHQSILFRSPIAGIGERKGKVIYQGDLIHPTSRVLTLTAEADNADRALKPGMFVEVGFDTGDASSVIQVPQTAILRDQNQPFVFVVRDDQSFVRRDVKLGRTAGEMVEIVAGLQEGEPIVIRNGFVLKSELLKDQLVGE